MGFASSARSIPLMTNLAALPSVVQILDLILAWFFFHPVLRRHQRMIKDIRWHGRVKGRYEGEGLCMGLADSIESGRV